MLANRSAELITRRYPATLEQLVPQISRHERLARSKSYTPTTNSIILSDDAIAPGEPMRLSDFIFLVGSSSHCRLLQNLKISLARESRTHQPCLPKDELAPAGGDVELGLSPDAQPDPENWNWRETPLSTSELHWLMVGQIADRSRSDRQLLWELVKRQREVGYHSARTGAKYIRLAVRYANNSAIDELCQIYTRCPSTWDLQPPTIPPLDLAFVMQYNTVEMFPIKRHHRHRPKISIMGFDLGWLRLHLGYLEFADLDKVAVNKTIATLRAHGYRESVIVRVAASWKGQCIMVTLWALVIVPLACLIRLPVGEGSSLAATATIFFAW